jgi:hypothetical protein
VHLGDIAYASAYGPDMFEAVWNVWFTQMQDITTRLPYMVAVGNHEENPIMRSYEAFLERFRMPYRESGAVNNMWYSFDSGYVHMIIIDSETDYPGAPGGFRFGDQLGWLEKDLEKAHQNRARVPLIFVASHRPIYESNAWSDDRKRLQHSRGCCTSTRSIFSSLDTSTTMRGPTQFGTTRSWHRHTTSPRHPYTLYLVLVVALGGSYMRPHPRHPGPPSVTWTALASASSTSPSALPSSTPPS